MIVRQARRLFCLSAIALLLAPTAWADALLDDARRLLAERKAKDAFTLLAPHESARAGEVQYDYLFGIAAIDAGDPQRAVFALERVLAVQPDFHLARAEIARAYFALGERENAQREFRTVREEQSVPSEARATIDRFLSALEPARTRLQRYLELTYGYDTNVNSATSVGESALPKLNIVNPFPLAPESRRTSDLFRGYAGGVSVSHAATSRLSLIGAMSGTAKQNLHADTFDTAVLDATGGTRYTLGANAFSAVLQLQSFRLDNTRFRDSVGGVAQWQYALSDSSQVSLFAQQARQRYMSQPNRDAERRIGGVAYAQAFAGRFSPVMFASLYAGKEAVQNYAFKSFGFTPIGVRIGGQLRLASYGDLSMSASYEQRAYDDEEVAFPTVRRDGQTDVRLGLTYPLYRGLSLVPQLAYTDNRSNVEIYAYRRTVTSVSLRLDF
jgi:hypothetical protein